ncbi:MAG: enoyl-CoA hydratase/isomerase family protein [Smithellaceae bacterium]
MVTQGSTYQTLLVKKEDAIATITLNRPDKLNAMSLDMFRELAEATEEVANDRDVRTVVVTGAGRAFSAGGDIDSPIFDSPEWKRPEFIHDAAYRSWQFLRNIRSMDKPVIAAVNGPAVGGGMCLAVACDMIIASEKAIFSVPFIKLGMHIELGIGYFLPRLVGIAKAFDICFTGRSVGAQEADRIGLVNQVVPVDQLEPTVTKLATTLAQGPPLALSMGKRSIYQSQSMDLISVMEMEVRAQAICMASEDVKEGVNAFKEKRKPVFQGK